MNTDSSSISRFSAVQVREARAIAGKSMRSVVEILEEQSGLDAKTFVRSLAAQFHYPAYAMEELLRLVPAFHLLSFTEAVERNCLVFEGENNEIIAMLSDPFNVNLQAWLEQRLTQAYSCALAHRSDISAFLKSHEESLHAMDSIQEEAEATSAEDGSGVQVLSIKNISEEASLIVRLVHSTIYDALKAEASDIHLEHTAFGLAIKYRIDGALVDVSTMDGLKVIEQVISRIKVISGLDITERRVPQDGRFKVATQGHEVDLRVSIMPGVFGECAVLRILDKSALSDQVQGLRLDHLGFDQPIIAFIRKLSNEPYGMVLVTGPTGSGKTTTLYAAITEINHGKDKIITIEDPVEYQLPGVMQIPVNEKKGLTFERGLRSILRHDPDKIMVGEIRDAETAQIAVQSALTGHLVFTTVHANNVFDVIGRFVNMGVDPYSFVSALNGIVAQRLVRVNCTHCIADDFPDEALILESGIKLADAANIKFRAGKGCGHCRGTGFKGRRAIAEVLYLNDEIRELIIAREPIRLVREAASRNGTRFLRDGAVDMVIRGESTLQEINRVTFVG